MFRSLSIAAALAVATPALAAAPTQHLCGWIENPTPGNWTLTDKNNEWVIGVQGGHQPDGKNFNFPRRKAYYIDVLNGYGYGCGCINATVDAGKHEVIAIAKASVLKLSVCRNDKALKEPK